MWSWRAMFAGVTSPSRATCPNTEMRRLDRRWDSEIRPVRWSTSSFQTRQRHNYFHSKTDSGKSGILRLIYCIKPKTKKWKKRRTNTHTHIRLTALFPGLPGDPIWILVKQETVSGSGIRWAICKSAPRSRQTTTPAPHHSVFYRPDALPAAQPTASKHWRQRRTKKYKQICSEVSVNSPGNPWSK